MGDEGLGAGGRPAERPFVHVQVPVELELNRVDPLRGSAVVARDEAAHIGVVGPHGEAALLEVIDDREGLPITLSVLYIEIARRLKLNVVGVPLPGHFVVRHEPNGGAAQIVDVFQGKVLSRAKAVRRGLREPLAW